MRTSYTGEKLAVDVNVLLSHFNLVYIKQPDSVLAPWLTATGSLDLVATTILGELEDILPISVNDWLEEDLKMKAISLIMFLAHIDEAQKIGVFYERALQWKTPEFMLSVVSDCMAASVRGRSGAGTPYFFLQKFKKSKGDKSDPEAQMLAAMLIAQHHNNNDKPLYGAYVMGRNWYFAKLYGKNYAISKAYDMTNRDILHQIVFILRKVKEIILTELVP